MSDDFVPTQDPAAFDMSFSTLSRLNYLLWQCNQASGQNDIPEWFKALKTIFKETYSYMKRKTKDKDGEDVTEKEYHRARLKEAEKQLQEYLDYVSVFNSQKNTGGFKPSRKPFDLFFDWEIELRSILDREGLMMKRSEDSGAAVMGMK